MRPNSPHRAAFVATIRFAWEFLDEQAAGQRSEQKDLDTGGPVIYWLPVPGQPRKLLALSSLALLPADQSPLDAPPRRAPARRAAG